MVFQQTPSNTEEIAPIIVVIAVGNGDGCEKKGFGCGKNRFLWLSDAVNRDLLSLRTQVLPEHSFARALDFERAGEIGRGEQLFYDLKRLTLNAPVYVVPVSDLPLLRCEPSLVCIVVHETVRSALDTSTLPVPHVLLEHNDAGELRFVAFVTKRKEKRTRKRRKRKAEEAR